jgi:hypothetical protein
MAEPQETQEQLAQAYAQQQKSNQTSSGESQEDLAKAYAEQQKNAGTPTNEPGVRPSIPSPKDTNKDSTNPYNKNWYDFARDYYERGTGIKPALGRLAMIPTNMAEDVGHALRPAETSEEVGVEAGGGTVPGSGRAVLAAKRLLVDPQVAEYEKARQAANEGKTSEALGHSAAAAIPLVGPYAANLGERAGRGDVSGALTELAGVEALPRIAKGARETGALGKMANPYLEEHTPTVGKIAGAPVRAASRAVENVAPVIPRAVGAGIGMAAATEAGIPHPYLIGGVTGAAASALVPKDLVTRLIEKGKTVGLSPEESAVVKLEDRAKASAKALAQAQADYDAYGASAEQGVEAPTDITKKLEKAKTTAAEDRFHADAAKEKLQPTKQAAPVAAAQPEAPITVRPTPQETIAPKAPQRAVNVKGPGEVQPETFPQEPKAKPQVNEGETLRLPNQEGVRVGKPKLLAETNPEPSPQQEILPPEKPVRMGKAAKPERGNVRSLYVDEAGNVQDREQTQEGLVGKLLEESFKPGPAGFPEAKVEETTVPEKGTTVSEKGTSEAKEEKPVREAVATPERSPEAKDAEVTVQDQASSLSDENLKKLAKAHGLDPESYDFKARDEGRHRVDRDQLVKDITAKMGDDEVQNIARNAANVSGPDMANFAKAEKAAKVFPRLRGEVDEFGNPKVSGGSQEATAPAAEQRKGTERRTEEGTSPTGDERRKSERRTMQQMSNNLFQESAFGKPKEFGGSIDTDAYAEAHVQARKELGKDASVQDVIKRRNEIIKEQGKVAETKDIGQKSRESNPEPTRSETKGSEVAKAADAYNK